jgi:uncharacterized protein
VIYVDTSFLAPLVLPEATSENVAAFVGRLPIGELAVSHWTFVEFSSLIARKVRARELDAEGAARAAARVEATVEASFAVLLPSLGDFVVAKRISANSKRACARRTLCISRSLSTATPPRSTPSTTGS